ncbi:Toxin SymE, type I toxin-antitoxin system [Chitinophaga sp. CF118]|uniref:type I addiction module toxin, SymE family n=1 Tax=Chitinophaga sp. CF118 TaxID=1884367 RepID=UPI0008EA47C7|nr:type I addiction module toxin, SymE family [Chitinophaga sp. CF118]SFD65233.1 Toxin SymE, type I toxin-antitoxin system [Chitinophaga sp. CF118]
MIQKTRRTKISGKTAIRKWEKSKVVSWISFSGIWIGNAGFNEGDSCEIKVRKNKLIITKVKSQIK